MTGWATNAVTACFTFFTTNAVGAELSVAARALFLILAANAITDEVRIAAAAI